MDAANTVGEWIARKMRSQRAYVGQGRGEGSGNLEAKEMPKTSLALPIHLGYKEGGADARSCSVFGQFPITFVVLHTVILRSQKGISLIDTAP